MKTNNIYKAIVVGAGEKIDFRTESILSRPRSQSDAYVKAVVFPGGELNLTGLIRIEKGARLSEAFLKQKVLLLGGDAKATAVPELEIETDEVKASHAATVGDLDQEQLFYLESRGLSSEEAKKVLVAAFLEDILPSVDMEEARLVRSKIEKWIR